MGFLIGALSLSGVPPLAGFWSKDAISQNAGTGIQFALALLSFLGAFYIARAYLLGFTGREGKPGNRMFQYPMELGIWVLALVTIAVGFIQSPFGSGWLGRYLHETSSTNLHARSAIHPALAILGWFCALCVCRWRFVSPDALAARWAHGRTFLLRGLGTDAEGFGLARIGVSFANASSAIDRHIFERLSNKAAIAALRFAGASSRIDRDIFERLSDNAAIAALHFATISSRMDQRVLDRAVENGAGSVSMLGEHARVLQTGRVYHYLAAAFGWVLVLVIITLAVRA